MRDENLSTVWIASPHKVEQYGQTTIDGYENLRHCRLMVTTASSEADIAIYGSMVNEVLKLYSNRSCCIEEQDALYLSKPSLSDNGLYPSPEYEIKKKRTWNGKSVFDATRLPQ